MAYKNTVVVNITLQAGTLSQRGFGTPIFITSHREFEERVRVYGSLTEVMADFDDTTKAYAAAQGFFSQTPAPSFIKIGRRGATAKYTPEVAVDGENYSIQIVYNNVTYTYTVAAGVGEDQEDIVDDLVALINAEVAFEETDLSQPAGDLIVAAKVGTGATAYMTLTGKAYTDAPTVYFTANVGADSTDITEATVTYVYGESASKTLAMIDYEDDDYYFVTSDTHTSSAITTMAAAVEAMDRQYFTSTNDADGATSNIASYIDDGSDTSIGGLLKQGNYTHTNIIFHEEADTKFVECYYVAAGAPYNAGSISWCNIPMTGIGASKNPNTGKYLTTTAKNNLTARNMNYFEEDGVTGTVTRDGITSGGEWIDVIHGVHWQKNDLTTNLKALLAGQKGGKLNGDDSGIARVRETAMSSLQRGVNRNFLSSYTITVPLQIDRSAVDVANRILTGVTFNGVLANAIQYVEISGTVTN